MSDIIAKLQSVVWAERPRRHNEAVLESFGTYIDGPVIDGLLVGGVISYTVPAVGMETRWTDSVGKKCILLKIKGPTSYLFLFICGLLLVINYLKISAAF